LRHIKDFLQQNGFKAESKEQILRDYGEKYTAYDELEKKGLVKKEDMHNHELNRKRFIYHEHNVTRKKDLF
jgi:hypothetical protein